MPSPTDFREQLNLAVLPKPKAKEDARESALQQLESQFSEFDQHHSQTGFRDSEVMGLSRLMDLNGIGRRPSGNGSNSSFGNSRFNGQSLDVRGG